MQLRLREAAELLNVSEDTVYRWIKERKLPALRYHEQYRFNRAELLEWATAQGIEVSVGLFLEPESGHQPSPLLAAALQAGGIHFRVPGGDKESVIQAAIELMPLPEDVDKAFLLSVLLARESMGSTGVGNGIAIPHVRNPMVLTVPQPMVVLCFLEQPIEFGAIDGHPVHTLFTMVSPTISAHLSLLSKLSFALYQPVFSGVIAQPGTADAILESAALIDRIVPHRAPAPVEEADD